MYHGNSYVLHLQMTYGRTLSHMAVNEQYTRTSRTLHNILLTQVNTISLIPQEQCLLNSL
jgi:hypothetical protein